MCTFFNTFFLNLGITWWWRGSISTIFRFRGHQHIRGHSAWGQYRISINERLLRTVLKILSHNRCGSIPPPRSRQLAKAALYLLHREQKDSSFLCWSSRKLRYITNPTSWDKCQNVLIRRWKCLCSSWDGVLLGAWKWHLPARQKWIIWYKFRPPSVFIRQYLYFLSRPPKPFKLQYICYKPWFACTSLGFRPCLSMTCQ